MGRRVRLIFCELTDVSHILKKASRPGMISFGRDAFFRIEERTLPEPVPRGENAEDVLKSV